MTFSDSKIVKMLKEDFTPVWVSVCPVRTVTFDLGEGRSLKGSVNGEIAIYFCNPDGTVYDILPALQSPAATLKAMKEARSFYTKETKDLEGDNIPYKKVMAMHRTRMEKVAGERFGLFIKDWGHEAFQPTCPT